MEKLLNECVMSVERDDYIFDTTSRDKVVEYFSSLFYYSIYYTEIRIGLRKIWVIVILESFPSQKVAVYDVLSDIHIITSFVITKIYECMYNLLNIQNYFVRPVYIRILVGQRLTKYTHLAIIQMSGKFEKSPIVY